MTFNRHRVSPRSDGIGVNNASGSGVQITNNIIANPVGSTVNRMVFRSIATYRELTTNNIIYHFATPIDDGGTGNNTSSNAINSTGYANPNVSVGSYNASLGGSATLAAFMAAADNQNMSNWNPAYTATAVNSYIQAGFSTGIWRAWSSDDCIVLDRQWGRRRPHHQRRYAHTDGDGAGEQRGDCCSTARHRSAPRPPTRAERGAIRTGT